MNAPVSVSAHARRGPRIGPNSVLHLVPLLDERLGRKERQRLLKLCGLDDLPSDDGLMDEGPAAELHQAVRRMYPKLAPALTREAGTRTGDHIIKHRVPVAAMRVLLALPPWLAGPLLASVIEKHAWTFAGSGTFRIRSRQPLVLELRDNPVVRGERAKTPICHWHAAVFERLFTNMVDTRLRCVETHCCAAGNEVCRFEIR